MTTLLQYFKECNYLFSTDSREISKGCIFFCLKGDTFNAHNFIDEVIEKGARYVVVDDDAYASKEKCIKVESVLTAMQELATAYRKEFTIPVLVIGGSNGKTTTKELTRVVLNTAYRVHSTNKNLNNHIGVPLTLLSMPRDTELAIIEIGANHPGEHAQLMNIVQPTHVIVTNNGKDHLEGFGSIEGVRKANAEIYEYAQKHGLITFVPDFELDLLETAHDLKKIVFGYSPTSTYAFESLSTMRAAVKSCDITYQSNLFGDFNEKNIMSAVAIGMHFKCDAGKIVKAIAEYEPDLLRSQIKEINGIRYVIDCYNANPSSMKEALVNFKKYTGDTTAVILGDMLEMGEYAEAEHRDILRLLTEFGFTVNILVGSNFLHVSEECKENASFHFFSTIQDAKKYIEAHPLTGFEVLLKGSNGIKIKEILA